MNLSRSLHVKLLLIFFVLSQSHTFSQTQKKHSDAKLYKNQFLFYKNLLSSIDSLPDNYEVKKTCLLALIISTPDSSIQYEKRLVEIYTDSKDFTNAYLLAKKLRKKYPDDIFIIETLAKVCELQGRYTEAIDCYDYLRITTGDERYYYFSASTAFKKGDYEKSYSDLVSLLKSESLADYYININFETFNQDIPILAAANHLLGLTLYNTKNKEESLIYLKKAVGIFPDYKKAKENLEVISKEE